MPTNEQAHVKIALRKKLNTRCLCSIKIAYIYVFDMFPILLSL